MSKRTRADRDKKYGLYASPATQIFHDKEMIVGRPPGMEFEEYKILRRIQTRVLKSILRKAPNKKIPLPLKPGYNYHG